MSPFWWLAIAAVMAVVEIASMGLITIWFVVGGLAAFVAGALGAGLVAQVVVFLVVSLATLLPLRPLILKHRQIGEAHEATPVGSLGLVVERVDPQAQTGRIETPDRMTWAALSADGTPIEVGEQVRVVDQQSVKLVVEWESEGVALRAAEDSPQTE